MSGQYTLLPTPCLTAATQWTEPPSTCPQALAVPTIDPARYDDLQIFNATDVTCWSDSAMPASPVTRAEAVRIALADSGDPAKVVRVLRGRGLHYPDGSERDVWIIVWKLGFWATGGPMGQEEQRFYLTVGGSFVDAETGEIWSGFSI